MEEKKYLKWYNKIGYGSGDIAGNVVYFTPTDMQRQGNKLLFAMRGAVAVEGGYGILYSGFTETLELPE